MEDTQDLSAYVTKLQENVLRWEDRQVERPRIREDTGPFISQTHSLTSSGKGRRWSWKTCLSDLCSWPIDLHCGLERYITDVCIGPGLHGHFPRQ